MVQHFYKIVFANKIYLFTTIYNRCVRIYLLPLVAWSTAATYMNLYMLNIIFLDLIHYNICNV